eukprot:1158143-Pelagomonas_calceolata.AAC.3
MSRGPDAGLPPQLCAHRPPDGAPLPWFYQTMRHSRQSCSAAAGSTSVPRHPCPSLYLYSLRCERVVIKCLPTWAADSSECPKLLATGMRCDVKSGEASSYFTPQASRPFDPMTS